MLGPGRGMMITIKSGMHDTFLNQSLMEELYDVIRQVSGRREVIGGMKKCISWEKYRGS